jgi:hypothetical protein
MVGGDALAEGPWRVAALVAEKMPPTFPIRLVFRSSE